MFFHYARLLLATLGMIIGLTGFYLDAVVQTHYKWLLWLGITFSLSAFGLFSGDLIQRLSVSSNTDFLTGLWNRRYLHFKLNKEKNRMLKKKMQLCIAMIDVDGFKMINDTYGHNIGDTLLSDLAAILRKNTRDTDIVARWGGDEFAIILPDTSLENALEVLERIRNKVEINFPPYHLTISAGITVLKPGQDLKNLLAKADEALYKAKRQKNAIIAVINQS
ncbi:hypothetical protein P22_3511 [Propionispora sp. 2/2-37]|uniref:GGDEF domain-containing protein n=1 Tax=Propionispora sp. 2/2-37 TaxID=1677858 RepID=UPI0006BB7E85|nr:GGDEF domain-containing protein [Propionispora sp. 2/2-37]CUH97383.1 hypothetical protein P22_3511 [Propionispora sp. 2/2-37]